MGGNVFQWKDTLIANIVGSFRGWRGGAWLEDSTYMASSYGGVGESTREGGDTGFRFAETPEPSSLVLATLGFIRLAAGRLRRR